MAPALMRRVRPFAGKALNPIFRPCRTRVIGFQSRRSIQKLAAKSDVVDKLPSVNTSASIGVALGLLGLTSRYAFADEVVSENLSSIPGLLPGDAEVLAASSAGSGVEQFIVSVLFGVVVVLLVIVTGGVAYINIRQWLDNRQEKDDRDNIGKAVQGAAASASTKDKATDDEVEPVISLKRASRIKKDKGKGFAQEFTSRR